MTAKKKLSLRISVLLGIAFAVVGLTLLTQNGIRSRLFPTVRRVEDAPFDISFAQPVTTGLEPITPIVTNSDKIVNSAKDQARRGVEYDASYASMKYPGGDVPNDRGACTDVLIRSLRAAGIDLQTQIHEDMIAHFDLYPQRYGLTRTDANIDHRRVPNHLVFMKRHALTLPLETTGEALKTWLPGDLVYWKMSPKLDHCGVLSNIKNAQGVPLVIHNCSVTIQEDALTEWKIAGHFRYPVK